MRSIITSGEQWVFVKTPSETRRKDYYISDRGRIKSVDKTTKVEKILKGSIHKKGYVALNLVLANGSTFSVYVARFVAEHFVKDRRAGENYVRHINKNISDNRSVNLQWATSEDIYRSFAEVGKKATSDSRYNPIAKLNRSRVEIIKRKLKEGKTRRKQLAKIFGISERQMRRIENGECWGDV